MVKNAFLGAEGNGAMTWVFVGLLVVLVIVLLVVPMFTNKKRAKQTTELHNSLKPGDVIKTVGGIIGTIKEIRKISPVDTEMVIETGDGDNKTTMTFDIQALYMIMNRSNTPAPAASDDVFDEPPAANTEDSAVVVKDDADKPATEEPEAKPVDKAETDAPEKEETAEPAASEEQAATAEEKAEEPVKQENEAPAKAKTSTAHKPVQKKSNSGGAKKSTKK